MAFIFPPDGRPPQRNKPKLDHEAMISGLLMGLATLGFAACLLLVMNGKAEKWMRQLQKTPVTQQAAPAEGGK